MCNRIQGNKRGVEREKNLEIVTILNVCQYYAADSD